MVSTKTKWRLGLLAAVVVLVLLPALFLLVRTLAKPQAMQVLATNQANAAPCRRSTLMNAYDSTYPMASDLRASVKASVNQR